MTMSKVAIIGAGWLGKPLAEHLKSNHFEVSCSTTTSSKADLLNQKGIPTYVLSDEHWSNEAVTSLLQNAKTAIITVPPSRETSTKNYLQKIERFVPHLIREKVEQVFFTSSTTVYISLSGLVDETSKILPQSEMDLQIMEVENYLLNQSAFQTTILRLGGLIGEDRHPVRFLAQRSEIQDANEPVNMIHQKDIIRFITRLMVLKKSSNEIYNIVAPILEDKRNFYTKEAERLGLKLPPFIDNSAPKYRRVDGSKITRATGLNYEYMFD